MLPGMTGTDQDADETRSMFSFFFFFSHRYLSLLLVFRQATHKKATPKRDEVDLGMYIYIYIYISSHALYMCALHAGQQRAE
jgi:hypothetical protein